jgi:hypothetical protein
MVDDRKRQDGEARGAKYAFAIQYMERIRPLA